MLRSLRNIARSSFRLNLMVMPKEAMHMIEKPFTKVDETSEGLGLGLPLCKRHAVTLGGDLVLDTSYTNGCRFILELPK